MKRYHLLLVLCLIYLAYASYSLYTALSYRPGQFRPPERVKTEIEIPSPTEPPEDWVGLVVQKNLFVPGRGEPPPEPEIVPEEVPHEEVPREEIVLKGIVYNQYGEYIAILQIGEKKPVRLKTGESVGEVKVMRIDDRTVGLMYGDIPLELTFKQVEELK